MLANCIFICLVNTHSWYIHAFFYIYEIILTLPLQFEKQHILTTSYKKQHLTQNLALRHTSLNIFRKGTKLRGPFKKSFKMIETLHFDKQVCP